MDVPVTVNTVWTGPAGFGTNIIAQPVAGSTTTYISTAMVSSFWREQSGNYTCTSTVSSINTSFIISSSKSVTMRLSLGKTIDLLPIIIIL